MELHLKLEDKYEIKIVNNIDDFKVFDIAHMASTFLNGLNQQFERFAKNKGAQTEKQLIELMKTTKIKDLSVNIKIVKK
jgi:hypothetical protein